MVLEPDLVIGLLDGDENYVFGRIASLGLGPDGLVYVLDRLARTIRVFDPEGGHIRNVGRAGDGPGEFGYTSGMIVRPDSLIMVFQGERGIATLLSLSGDPLGSTRWPPSLEGSAQGPIYADRMGHLYQSRFLPDEEWDIPPGFRVDPRRNVVRFDLDGSSETLPVPAYASRPYDIFVGDPIRGSAGIPFVGVRHLTVSLDGHVVVSGEDDYELGIRAWNGGLTRIVRTVSPVLAHDDEWRFRRDRVRASLRRAEPNWEFSDVDVPRVKAPVKGLHPATDGRVWVERATPAVWIEADESRPFDTDGIWWEPPAWDVFEPDGTFVGQVSMATETYWEYRPIEFVFAGDEVWAVSRDELDVERVVRFRVTRNTPPPDP